MYTPTPVTTSHWLAVVVSTLFVASLTGCGLKPIDDRLVGKWEPDTTKEDRAIFEFKSDGTYTITYGLGEERRSDPGRWWVLRQTDSGIVVRFDTDIRRPNDRMVDFFDDRIDFREKDGGFISSYFRFGASRQSDVSDTDDGDKPDLDSEASPTDTLVEGSPLDGVNFDAAKGRLPITGQEK